MKSPTFRLSALMVSAVLALSGCTSVADIVGYDSATLNESAAKSYTQVMQQAKSKRILDTTSHTSRRIQTVFNRLKPYAEQANQTGVPFRWEMSVIKSDELNAWAMPGGKMAMYTGMVDRLKLSDDEIAAVVGHEMTHALLEHSKKAIGQQVLTGLAADIGGSLISGKAGVSSDIVGLSSNILSQYGVNMPFSRSQEREADAGGVRLMAQAGYNPQAAITVWEKMNRISDNNNTWNAITSSHPTNNARIQAIRNMLPEVMPIYERNKRGQNIPKRNS
ncbi:peptidase, M48 family [Neisseria animaloris]|uniref:Peptidase, M48 family n=1 Tax=Neisseria animaloris TaxID=326522 RepID=A0A1X3CHJ4_9NEIS|nr:M48 family metallopeptidase [Neisseria animaloris]OSI07110.1 deoxyribonuclease HsdR [Neisseria animaloris]VEH87986.1 peptidase, M48 family [Neisseria animaloris]VEJ21968.1 peptidase, M48 family [Neisseria animaloris]